MPKRMSMERRENESLAEFVERCRKKFQAAVGDQIHYLRDAKDDPKVQAFNMALKKQRLRKVN